MTETSLPAESEENLRRARVRAKWSMRHYRREFGGYNQRDLLHAIRMAGWLFERIRVEGQMLSGQRLTAMHEHLLLKLALAEIAITESLGGPAPAARCST